MATSTVRSARGTAMALAVGRAAIGATALVRPALPARPWIGDPADDHRVAVLSRALGGRDLVIAAGALRALVRGRGDEAVAWVAAGALADAVDAGSTAATWGSLPRIGRVEVVGLAAGAAATGAWCCAALRGRGSAADG